MPKTNTKIKNFANESGFSHIFVLISFLAVLGVAGFFMKTDTSIPETNVLGSANTSSASTQKGFAVIVSSQSGNWDFYEFLCKTYEECTKSLISGVQLSTISGGQTDSYEIVIEPSSEWELYKFIKYFVKTGWADSNTKFIPQMTESVEGGAIYTFDDAQVQTVIAPTTPFFENFYNATRFSDN